MAKARDDTFFWTLVVFEVQSKSLTVHLHRLILFQVEGILFHVPKEELVKNSDIFASMFSLPPEEGKPAQGLDEDNPIQLAGVSANEFRALLLMLYPKP